MEKKSLQPSLNDLARATEGRHNLAAYLFTLLLYRHNGDAGNDDPMRRYMRWVKGEEGSWTMAVVVDHRVGG